MAKNRRAFVCRECGAETAAWAGHCGPCGSWGTIDETSRARGATRVDSDLASLASYDLTGAVPVPSGLTEIDRVLGGGLVPGSVTLLGGEPGIGKSTLSLQLAVAVAATGAGVLIVTGEEAPGQVAARAGRLGPIPESLQVVDQVSVEGIEGVIDRERPQLVVVDSIQTLLVADGDGVPGSVTQVRASAHRLVAVAKRVGSSILVIGHVTKDGSLAGPRLLEHVVDTVLSFSGDRHHELRFLRAVKHRFGPTTDVGVFEMTSGGLSGVADPSQRFLADRRAGVPGSIVVPALEERRPVLVEVQSLVASIGDRPPQLTAQGVSSGRLKLVSAVLQQRGGVALWGLEIFASVAGGASVDDPGADLGLALSVASSVADRCFEPDLVACGELGLAGEVRSVANLERRLQEAQRLGFRRAVVPASVTDAPAGLELLRVETLAGALDRVGLQAVGAC